MATDFIKLQHETIERVIDLLKSYKDVELIFIMGSHAKGEEGSFSDIDIGFVFSSPEKPQREEIFNKVASLYPSLCALWLYDKNGLFLYRNGIRLDLDFLIPKDLKDWDLSKVKIVYDPQNKYQDKISRAKEKITFAPKPKWREKDGDMIDWFFWMFRQVYCWIRRGATNQERSFNKLYSSQDSLKSIRDKLLEIVIYLNGRWDYLINIDKNLTQKLTSTFTDLKPDNMTRATRDLFDIFEDIGRKYCEKENKKFPQGKVTAMRKLFDEFDQVQN